MYKVALVYQQESIVLHQLDIEDLEDLIYEDLPPLYMDQLDLEERKDARIRENRIWSEVSWEVAKEYILDRLNEFMYQYFRGNINRQITSAFSSMPIICR